MTKETGEVRVKLTSADVLTVDKKKTGIFILTAMDDGRILRMNTPALSVERIQNLLEVMDNPSLLDSKYRPEAHDLMAAMMHAMNISLDKVVVVSSPKDGVFNARGYVTKPVSPTEVEYAIIEGRPSDLITIAVATSSPIFVDEELLNVPE